MNKMVNSVKDLLDKNDGHGFDHVERVLTLARKFSDSEGADRQVVELACLLHDVDDYKLFGEESEKHLLNANRLLKESNIDSSTREEVLEIIRTIGYSKSLSGIRPSTIEGMIVSDADMCDAIGAEGILRTHAYNLSKGNAFFDKSIFPVANEKSSEEYRKNKLTHAVQHFFDKLLRISSILLTRSGQEEGKKRQKIMVDFLYELFHEEEADQWIIHLNDFLRDNSAKGHI
jgi:uncharacterized protein